jgi:hypothetical protein
VPAVVMLGVLGGHDHCTPRWARDPPTTGY